MRKAPIDEGLISRSADGDRASREELARACLPYVWKTVYLSCNGGPEVEDLVQSAILQAFVDLPRFKGTGSFTSWLYRVTLNVVRRHFRRRFVRSLLPLSGELDGFPDEARSPDAEIEGERFLERLAGLLRGMREKNRSAVVLSIVGDYSASEIALIVGCSVETARKRLARGRRELVEKVRRDPYCRQLIEELGI